VRNDAFTKLYERHHQALYRYCRSIVRHDEDARDALQSTFTKAYRALQTEGRDVDLRPWLFRIAHNESISLIRARRATETLDAAAELGEERLARDVEAREELRLLQEDLADLADRHRSALILRELNGLGHDEIAQVLQTTPGAVKQVIFEARTALQQCRAGREMPCQDVCRALSDGDRRSLRARRYRAHLRECGGCRAFRTALSERPQQLAVLFALPPLAAGADLLSDATSALAAGAGESAGTSTAGVSTAAASTGAGGGAAGTLTGSLGAVLTAKAAAVAAAGVAVLAGGTVVVAGAVGGGEPRAVPQAVDGRPGDRTRPDRAADPAAKAAAVAGTDGEGARAAASDRAPGGRGSQNDRGARAGDARGADAGTGRQPGRSTRSAPPDQTPRRGTEAPARDARGRTERTPAERRAAQPTERPRAAPDRGRPPPAASPDRRTRPPASAPAPAPGASTPQVPSISQPSAPAAPTAVAAPDAGSATPAPAGPSAPHGPAAGSTGTAVGTDRSRP